MKEIKGNEICEEHGKVRKHCFKCRWTVEELKEKQNYENSFREI